MFGVKKNKVLDEGLLEFKPPDKRIFSPYEEIKTQEHKIILGPQIKKTKTVHINKEIKISRKRR